MEILIDEDALITFHEILIRLYEKTEYPITLGYS